MGKTLLLGMDGRISIPCRRFERIRTTTRLSELFDDYALRARVYPGLLTVLPILTTVLLVWPGSDLRGLWSVFVGVGGWPGSSVARVRDDPAKYPRVHEENVNYGFRRNLLSLKALGLVLTALIVLVDAVVVVQGTMWGGPSRFGIEVLIALGLDLLGHQGVFDSAWTYALRLFETLDQDGLTSPSSAPTT